MMRLEIMPWTSARAKRYGPLRAELQRRGRTLSALDRMISAQAIEIGAVLATSDRAFGDVEGLGLVDWSRA